MKIFLSYASEQQQVAERTSLALEASGQDVFFDREDLQAGGDYNRRIREAIRASDFFIFLISPESVQFGSYALTELRFARKKWPTPHGRVLPVVVAPTSLKRVPNYLKAATLLEPEGDIPAEVVAEIVDSQVPVTATPPTAEQPASNSGSNHTALSKLLLWIMLSVVLLTFVLWAVMNRPESPRHLVMAGLLLLSGPLSTFLLSAPFLLRLVSTVSVPVAALLLFLARRGMHLMLPLAALLWWASGTLALFLLL